MRDEDIDNELDFLVDDDFDPLLGVLNVPEPRENPRPEFLCARDHSPVQPLELAPA